MIGDLKRFCDAIKDYRYLLDRGYSRESVLPLVASRYRLSDVERAILYRCVHPSAESDAIRGKIVESHAVKDSKLVIDGYNVMVTLETGLQGEPLFIGDDGIVRDVRKSYRKYSYNPEEARRTLGVIAEELERLMPRRVLIVYDSQVSWSGELASLTRRILSGTYECDVVTAPKADRTIMEMSRDGITSTSDVVILKAVPKIFDLPAHVVGRRRPETIYKHVIECLKR